MVRRSIPEVEAQATKLQGLLRDAERAIARPGLGRGGAFTGAVFILLREVSKRSWWWRRARARRAGRPPRRARGRPCRLAHRARARRGHLVLASYVITVTGATRETLEGTSALLAAVVLLFVGFWLHDKAHADRWQAYLRGRLEGALGPRTGVSLALVVFLAVYREVFETVLFYQALWFALDEGAVHAFVAGIGAAAVCLVILGGLIVRDRRPSYSWATDPDARRVPRSRGRAGAGCSRSSSSRASRGDSGRPRGPYPHDRGRRDVHGTTRGLTHTRPPCMVDAVARSSFNRAPRGP
jgi:hypothetical protein